MGRHTCHGQTRRPAPTIGFMTVDKDGKFRMDCSSPYAMASLIALKDRFDMAFSNDSDLARRCGDWQDAGVQLND